MVTVQSSHFNKNILYTAIIILVLGLQACARKITINPSPLVPAATGKVSIKKDNNRNYAINVKVRNLASARNLQPPRSTYVVWMDTERNGLKNIGQLKSSSALFSGALKASLSTVSPFAPVRIFITAEDDGSAQYPGIQDVLNTGIFLMR